MNAIIMLGTIDFGQNEIVKNIIQQICYNVKDVEVIDFFRSNKMQKLHSNITKKYIFKQEDWNEERKNIEKFLNENNYDNVFVLKSQMLKSFKNGNYDLVKNFKKAISNEDFTYSRNFMFTKKILEKILFVSCIAKTSNIIQVIIDPQEPIVCNYVSNIKSFKKVYILKTKEIEYLPFYEFMMSKFFENKSKIKINDLCFYCSALTQDRDFILKHKSFLEYNFDAKIVSKTDNKQDRNPIKQTVYYEKLCRAKFTLIIPSYDIETFSIIRFFEAIMADCLPIILKDVCLNHLSLTFPDIYEIIKESLVLDRIENINKKMDSLEKERCKFLNKIKNTKSYKQIISEKYVKNSFNELLGMEE